MLRRSLYAAVTVLYFCGWNRIVQAQLRGLRCMFCIGRVCCYTQMFDSGKKLHGVF